MAKKTQDLQEFLVDELRDLYDAEKQLTKALPRMAKAAASEELRTAITEHLEVTKGHITRLEECFAHLEQKPRSKPCKGIKGILDEGREMLEEDLEEAVMDAAIAAGGRKVEHYEIVAYESCHAIAEQLGLDEVADLLNQTLGEEREADQTLLQICRTVVEEAQTASEPDSAGDERSRGKAKTGTPRHASGGNGHTAHPLIDHDEIRRWAEERGATPSCVRGTGKKGDVGMIRLDFPGYSGGKSLQQIDWNEWFRRFDENRLALMVQDTTAGGERSNFNKLVSRESIQEGRKTRTA